MKNLIVLIVLSMLILGCSNKKDNVSKENETEKKVETKAIQKTESNIIKTKKPVESTIISEFLKNVNSLNQVKKPIKTFIEEAERTADKSVPFSKDNIQEVLDESVNYKGFVIVVEDHTIVKIGDVKKCKASGSWGACMPFAKGFIKKGDLKYQEDYCNFIIGKPNNSKKRIAYFFK